MTKAKDAPLDPAPGLWLANDAARYLKVGRSWVYQRAESGEFPCLHVGALIRFDPATVRAFARGEIHPARVLPTRPSAKRTPCSRACSPRHYRSSASRPHAKAPPRAYPA
jgi:excisionase family DNA binding protein